MTVQEVDMNLFPFKLIHDLSRKSLNRSSMPEIE